MNLNFDFINRIKDFANKERLSNLSVFWQSISKRKYFIASIVFVLWIIFFDQNSIIDKFDSYRSIKKLQQAKEFYKAKIKIDSVQLHDLNTNKATFEKFAREQYFMKRDNEDVFLVVDDAK